VDIGIDTYSYHRLYGEVRNGETQVPPNQRWPHDPERALAHAAALRANSVFLETCYLPPADQVVEAFRGAPGRLRLGFSWGHPWPMGTVHGLDGGRSAAAETDLRAWIDASAGLSLPLMRFTAGSPASRGDDPADKLVHRLVAPIRRSADYAAEKGVALALENHGDLTAVEMVALLSIVERGNLGVCLDNVNLVRVGDDMAVGTDLLAPHTIMVQLKDCEGGDPTVPGGPISTALGEGTADIAGVLGTLRRHGFQGPVCVELGSLPPDADELALVERSVTWLRAQPGGVHQERTVKIGPS
jgi:sugar phosphate isomerase/epimerase